MGLLDKIISGIFPNQKRCSPLTRQQIGVIVVGAGMIAERHIKALKQMKDVQVMSVCAKNLPSAAHLAKKYGIPSCYAGHLDALDQRPAGREIVIIATPPHTHYEIAMAAINSGRDVLVEKPAALNSQQVRDIAQEAESKGVLAGSFTSRFINSPLTARLREIISSGQLGELYRIEIVSRTRKQRYGIEYNPKAQWALSKEKAGGGALIDWGMYALAWIDALIHLPPLECIASQTRYQLFPADLPQDITYDVEDAAYAMYRAESGLLLSLDVAWAEHAPPKRHALILGTKGGLEVRWVPPFEGKLYITDAPGKTKDEALQLPKEAFSSEFSVIENFLASLDDKNSLALPLSREAELMDILMSCYSLAEKP